ncbi:MAG: hypothetical protein OET90_07725 [Desulfuromonadales bacterium]|nr:hypothetical protein [Desulfuromonadales bacterium]
MNDTWQDKVPVVDEKSLYRLAVIVYALQALSFFTGGLTLFAGIIINYVRKEDVAGSWLESHFKWQMRTFWYSLLLTIIRSVLLVVVVGWVVLAAASLWLIYRIVKGWLYLSENRSMPE